MNPELVMVEAHGNQSTLDIVACNFAKKKYPGCEVVSVTASGMRCEHGYIVWAVDVLVPA